MVTTQRAFQINFEVIHCLPTYLVSIKTKITWETVAYLDILSLQNGSCPKTSRTEWYVVRLSLKNDSTNDILLSSNRSHFPWMGPWINRISIVVQRTVFAFMKGLYIVHAFLIGTPLEIVVFVVLVFFSKRTPNDYSDFPS